MNPNDPNDPTADHHHHPKGPNFLLIVILASIVLIAGLIAAYFLVSADGRKMLPHRKNPEPNSLSLPYVAPPAQIRTA